MKLTFKSNRLKFDLKHFRTFIASNVALTENSSSSSLVKLPLELWLFDNKFRKCLASLLLFMAEKPTTNIKIGLN